MSQQGDSWVWTGEISLNSHCHSILTPGQLTLERQAPGRVASRESLERLNREIVGFEPQVCRSLGSRLIARPLMPSNPREAFAIPLSALCTPVTFQPVLLFGKTASLALWLRRPPWERKVWGSNPACEGIFPGRVIPVTLKFGTAVAALTGAWLYRDGAGTGWPGVSILWLSEVESLICNLYLSVAARTLVLASLRYSSMLLGR